MIKVDVSLLNSVEEIEKLYQTVTSEAVSLQETLFYYYDKSDEYNDKMNQYKEILRTLLRRKYEIQEPSLSDGVIDLYLESDSLYTICEHDDDIPVGTIAYKETNHPIPGNVSYEINRNYRGHHYALRALRILGHKLLDDGVTSIFITADSLENTPSIKTIEEFGGTKYKSEFRFGVVPYICDLENIYQKK